MKKVTVAVLVFTLLMILPIVAPALAEPAEKVPVELRIRLAAQVNSAPEKSWTTDGGIKHEQGIIRTVPLDTGLTKNVDLKINGVSIYGTVYAIVDVMTNTKTGVAINHYLKWIITFPVQPGVSVEGSFEGVNTYIVDSGPPVEGVGHAVLQGNGGFEGQTLSISMEIPPVPAVWYGYLLSR